MACRYANLTALHAFRLLWSAAALLKCNAARDGRAPRREPESQAVGNYRDLSCGFRDPSSKIGVC